MLHHPLAKSETENDENPPSVLYLVAFVCAFSLFRALVFIARKGCFPKVQTHKHKLQPITHESIKLQDIGQCISREEESRNVPYNSCVPLVALLFFWCQFQAASGIAILMLADVTNTSLQFESWGVNRGLVISFGLRVFTLNSLPLTH